MIGNKYLQELFECPDEDSALNQLLELLKSKDTKLMDSLDRPVDLNLCNNEEIIFLTKVAALVDYYLQLHGIKVPAWIRDEKLEFERPYYHSQRLSDFEKFKLQYTNPSPFKIRNVYFDPKGIGRI